MHPNTLLKRTDSRINISFLFKCHNFGIIAHKRSDGEAEEQVCFPVANQQKPGRVEWYLNSGASAPALANDESVLSNPDGKLNTHQNGQIRTASHCQEER